MAQEKINEELMDAVHALVKIKKVPESVVFEALEMVLLTAYKKEHGNTVKASIDMDHTTGKYHIYLFLLIGRLYNGIDIDIFKNNTTLTK